MHSVFATESLLLSGENEYLPFSISSIFRDGSQYLLSDLSGGGGDQKKKSCKNRRNVRTPPFLSWISDGSSPFYHNAQSQGIRIEGKPQAKSLMGHLSSGML